MHFSLPRAASLLLSAFLTATTLFFGFAGELMRPVPSNAQVTRFTRFNIRYSLRDVIADGVQKVEFYITEDMGRTWRLYGEDADRMSPMTIEVPGEGVYGFVSIATDRFGNREREPSPHSRPEMVIVVDRTPPTAKWLAPLQNILGKGDTVELSWDASDLYFGSGPVKIQYAADANSNHDRDAVWNNLQENLSAKGSINWTPPSNASARYNFRLIAEDRAGNLAVVYNPATIVVDSQPPLITSVSPRRSNKLRNDIQVDADDGPSGSGVKDISLYTSDNDGGSWTLVKERTDTGDSIPVKRASGQTILFEAPNSGTYGLWPVVFDMAGNATPLPPVGSIGPYVLAIDTEPPVATLSNSFLMGRAAVLANETRRVEWTAYDPHLEQNSAVIHLSLDNGNTWQELRSFLPANGSEVINFPFGSQSEEAKLKVTVRDEFGNVGEAVSETFKLSGAETVIDSVTPVGQTPPYQNYLSGDGGTAPYIAPPTGSEPVSPYAPTPSQPQPPLSSYDPYAPVSSDPYAPSGSTGTFGPFDSPAPSSSSDTFFDSYDSSAGAVPDGSASESTAGSYPRAMLGKAHETPTQAPSTTPYDQSTSQAPAFPALPPPPATPSASSPSTGWAPTPGAGPAPAPTIPPAATTTPPWQTDSGISAPPPSSPTPPSTSVPAQPSSPPAFGSWPTPSSGTDSGLMPPPLPGEGSGSPSLPPLSTSPGTSSPFDDWGSDLSLSLPPLGGPDDPFATASTPPAAPSTHADPSIPQPSEPEAPAVPQTPIPPPAISSGGLRPPAPATTSVPAIPQTGSSPLPSIAGFEDNLTAPPLTQPGTAARPTNPRQLSNHYADESKAYLDEGRVDLALDSGTKALNTDDSNPRAYTSLSQAYVQQEPPNFARAATLAKEATELDRNWDSWWNCADVFYRWAHARNKTVQAQIRTGQRPAPDLMDERNQALSNAQIAIGNSAMLVQNANEIDRKQVAITQGEITYLRALTIPEPTRPAGDSGPALDQYHRDMAAYKNSVTPILLEALPYFQTAIGLDGLPSYRETFHLGIINFRLGGLERDVGNQAQAATYYTAAARFLEEATTAKAVPSDGPREAYYMLAYCHDQLAEHAGPNRARHKELALRYWRQTADFYPSGTAYRSYAEQRVSALAQQLGQ